jgi:hypothetical protein
VDIKDSIIQDLLWGIIAGSHIIAVKFIVRSTGNKVRYFLYIEYAETRVDALRLLAWCKLARSYGQGLMICKCCLI